MLGYAALTQPTEVLIENRSKDRDNTRAMTGTARLEMMSQKLGYLRILIMPISCRRIPVEWFLSAYRGGGHGRVGS